MRLLSLLTSAMIPMLVSGASKVGWKGWAMRANWVGYHSIREPFDAGEGEDGYQRDVCFARSCPWVHVVGTWRRRRESELRFVSSFPRYPVLGSTFFTLSDGNRLLVMQHTLHIAFLPFLDPDSHTHHSSSPSSGLHRSHSFFSLPATPHPQLTPDTGIFSKTHPASSARWPLRSFLSALKPRNLAVSLTTLHLKLHTRLVFNEHGKIIVHEDTWGLKEIVEGVFPIIGHLYAINRQGLGLVAGVASRTLFGALKEGPHDEESARHEGIGGMVTPDLCPVDEDWTNGIEGQSMYPAGSPISTRKSSLSGAPTYGGGGGAMRLCEKPTTIDVEDSS
jgi:hypothetical protein